MKMGRQEVDISSSDIALGGFGDAQWLRQSGRRVWGCPWGDVCAGNAVSSWKEAAQPGQRFGQGSVPGAVTFPSSALCSLLGDGAGE